MNTRIWCAVVGLAMTLLSAVLLQVEKKSWVLQLGLILGIAIGFLAIGIEHFHESPILDKFTSRKTKSLVGSLFVIIGLCLLALTVWNLLQKV